METIRRKCEVCEKEYVADKSLVLNGRRLTCSLECSYVRRVNIRANVHHLEGKRFGMLTVISRKYSERKKVYWECICDCGNTKLIITQSLTRTDGKESRSCGCQARRKGSRSPAWRGSDKLPKSYWSSLKAGAKSRGYEFNVDMEFMASLFSDQDGKCALSGRDISLNETASLDRIDSSVGYVKNNVQWVHKDINRLKSNFPEDQFIRMCSDVANYHSLTRKNEQEITI